MNLQHHITSGAPMPLAPFCLWAGMSPDQARRIKETGEIPQEVRDAMTRTLFRTRATTPTEDGEVPDMVESLAIARALLGGANLPRIERTVPAFRAMARRPDAPVERDWEDEDDDGRLVEVSDDANQSPEEDEEDEE